MKLVNKVSFFTLSSSLLILIMGGGLIFIFFDKIIKDDAYHELNYYMQTVTQQLEDGVSVEILERNENLSILALSPHALHNENPRYGKVKLEEDVPPHPRRPDDTDFNIRPLGQGFEKATVIRDVYVKKQWFRVTYSRVKIAPSLLLFTTFKSIFILLLLLIVSTIIGNRILFNFLFQPFYATLNQLKFFSITKKNTLKFAISNVDEFNFLNEKVSYFAQRSQSDYDQLREFSENASHELQTPLAIIRSKLDLLQQSDNLKEQDLIRIEEIQETLQKITQLNRALLLLNKIGNHQFSDRKIFSINAVIKSNLKHFSEMILLKNLKVNTSLEDFTIHANPYLIDVFIRNLIQNAIQHNFYGGNIRITSFPNKILITNDGEALESDAEHYFQRFKKGNQGLSSTGLGLSIVKKICEVEGFTVVYSAVGTRHSIQINF
ncbi:sensor histidine kinase [Flavobacterium algicola]|uniref:sensor histidine kinase n=1 Tax=Flavobacterium algicola TaxID=556529 RepID=UPI001EFD0C93|nr:HAMP domain-containing sensor histidine kinase [Flavobacterium algicola]MCG9793250.1 HAMP domain-containing histidine kinase [Flavobacterium algicola]